MSTFLIWVTLLSGSEFSETVAELKLVDAALSRGLQIPTDTPMMVEEHRQAIEEARERRDLLKGRCRSLVRSLESIDLDVLANTRDDDFSILVDTSCLVSDRSTAGHLAKSGGFVRGEITARRLTDLVRCFVESRDLRGGIAIVEENEDRFTVGERLEIREHLASVAIRVAVEESEGAAGFFREGVRLITELFEANPLAARQYTRQLAAFLRHETDRDAVIRETRELRDLSVKLSEAAENTDPKVVRAAMEFRFTLAPVSEDANDGVVACTLWLDEFDARIMAISGFSRGDINYRIASSELSRFATAVRSRSGVEGLGELEVARVKLSRQLLRDSRDPFINQLSRRFDYILGIPPKKNLKPISAAQQ